MCKTGFLGIIFVWVKILVLVLKKRHRLRMSEKIMHGRKFVCERVEVTSWRRILLDGRYVICTRLSNSKAVFRTSECKRCGGKEKSRIFVIKPQRRRNFCL
jgi:hypothetical protein